MSLFSFVGAMGEQTVLSPAKYQIPKMSDDL